MEIRYSNHYEDSKHYTTEDLRRHYLQERVYIEDEIALTYSHVDRIIFGGAMPVCKALKLEAGDELKADYFLQRREMGVINVGGPGALIVDGTTYPMENKDGIYIGMGNKEIIFKSDTPSNPAKFYIASAPAHKTYKTVKIDIASANHVDAGDENTMNKRVLNQYLHPNVCETCQLSMGLTSLAPKSAWNSMPCHTHERRMEVYMYFDLPEDDIIVHLMGQPQETRHIIIKNEQAVISPSWSIHCGVGTTNYSFIWAMCGENQEFTDMDHIQTKDLL